MTRRILSRLSGIVSPGRQFGTAVSSIGGSAGVPSPSSSLKMKAIRLSLPSGWGRTAARAYVSEPGLGAWALRLADAHGQGGECRCPDSVLLSAQDQAAFSAV